MKNTFSRTKGFAFKRSKKVEFPGILKPEKPRNVEALTGQVQGRKASDIEERFAKALDRFKLDYSFQRYVPTEYTLPDNEKQVDFVVYTAKRVYPVEIYGSYWHSSAGDRLRDFERERQLNVIFRQWGWEDMQVVWDWELYDMQAAYDTVRRMFT